MSARIATALAGIMLAGTITSAVLASDDSVDNPDHCKVVKLKPGEHKPSGALSSSVTAGNGKVTAHTSGGHGVTVHAGNGSVSSSVATTGSGNGTTTVTSSDGNCTIYVDPEKKKDN